MTTLKECRKFAVAQGGECLSGAFRTLRTQLLWRCRIGHEWAATYRKSIRAALDGQWCESCRFGRDLSRSLLFACDEHAKTLDGACLASSGYHIATDSVLGWTCAYGHVWNNTVADVLIRGMWCTECRNSLKKPHSVVFVTVPVKLHQAVDQQTLAAYTTVDGRTVLAPTGANTRNTTAATPKTARPDVATQTRPAERHSLPPTQWKVVGSGVASGGQAAAIVAPDNRAMEFAQNRRATPSSQVFTCAAPDIRANNAGVVISDRRMPAAATAPNDHSAVGGNLVSVQPRPKKNVWHSWSSEIDKMVEILERGDDEIMQDIARYHAIP